MLPIKSKEQDSTLSSDSIMEPECVSISKEPILLPYIYSELGRHRNYPHLGMRELIKDYNEHAWYKHGNPFMSGPPRDIWLVKKGKSGNPTIIVTMERTEYVKVYFRPTVGNQCDCRQIYDGNKYGIIYAQENYLVSHMFISAILTNLQYNTRSVYSNVSGINMNCSLFFGAYSVSALWILEAYTVFVRLSKPRDSTELF